MDLYPLTFPEFLGALDEHPLLDLLKSQDWSLIKNFRSRFTELLKQYYYVGGMPEAVVAFSLRKDSKEVRQIQKRILLAYEQDFSKHAPNEIVLLDPGKCPIRDRFPASDDGPNRSGRSESRRKPAIQESSNIFPEIHTRRDRKSTRLNSSH